jgi:hypothetical protein
VALRFAAVFFTVFLAAVVFRVVVFFVALAEGFLAAVRFLAVVRFAAVFFAAVVRAEDFFAAARFGSEATAASPSRGGAAGFPASTSEAASTFSGSSICVITGASATTWAPSSTRIVRTP